MDPNLTPVFLNASINATISPAPSNIIKDWLPSMVTIIVVVMGGFLTYFFSTKLEKQKRLYELKKEGYLGLLTSLVEAKRNIDSDTSENDLDKKVRDIGNMLDSLHAQIYIFANEKVNNIVESIEEELRKTNRINPSSMSYYYRFIELLLRDLPPAIREDLELTEIKKRGDWCLLLRIKSWWYFKRARQKPERILWILKANGGEMDRSRLERCTGMRYEELSHILKILENANAIRVSGQWIAIW